MEQGLDADDDSGGVDLAALEIAHDLEELVVLLALVLELLLDGLEVGEGIGGGEAPLRRGRRRRRRRHVEWMVGAGETWDGMGSPSPQGLDWFGLDREVKGPCRRRIQSGGGGGGT